MWCHNHVRMCEKRMIRRWWFVFKYVKSGSSYNALIKCLNESLFINNATACTVNDSHTLFHDLKLWLTYHMTCFVCKWCVDSNKVRCTYNLICISQFNS